ncbi:hypothetical protein ACHAWF_007680 [Thalassiosira exigua]
MKCRNLSNLLVHALVLLSGIVASTKASPFVPRSTPSNPLSPQTQQALGKLRGGGLELCAVDSAKAITKLGLVVGTATTLSTKTVLDKSGIDDVDPIGLLVARRTGLFILSYSIAAYFLLVQDASAPTAVGIGSILNSIELSRTLFDGEHKELGFPAAGQAIVLIVNSILSYSLLNDGSSDLMSKDAALKLFCWWNVLNGMFLGCFPKAACKAWGDIDAASLLTLQKFVSVWGFSLVSFGALSGLLATDDMSTGKALALCALPFLCRLALSKFV